MAKSKRRKQKDLARCRRRLRRRNEPQAPAAEIDFSDPQTLRIANLVLALKYREQLGFDSMDPFEALEKLGLPRENAMAAADALERRVAELSQRGPGRPRKDPDEYPATEQAVAVNKAVIRYLMDHPGTAYRGKKRNYYSDEFKAFAVGLMSEGGVAEGMTVREAAYEIGVPANTLTRWLSARKK
jgi:hypothetical protein